MTGLPRGSVPAALPPPPSSDQREVTSWLKSRSVVSRTITEIGRGACHHRPMADVTRPRRREAYAERFARGDSYGLLLVLLLVLYIVMAATNHQSLWGRWAISMLLGAVMLLTLHTSHVRARGFHLGIAIVLIAETSNLLQAVFNESTGTGATFLMFLLVLAAPVVILNRILRHETVGLETILGAICIYVLIAIAFSGLYAWVNEVEPSGFFAQHIPNPQNVDFLYFSFVTITTVGYGDLTAGTSLGRVLVTFEAMVGQIFLVTLVARLVGMYGARQRPTATGTGESSGLEE
jgi:uncharacterized membrane protein